MKRKKQPAQNFAERLRQLIEASGLSQGEVARRADVSPQVVSRLLTAGNAAVTLSIACRLAWAMGKSVSEFEDAVFEEWKMQPKTQQLMEREMARGRLRQKLDATRSRIAEWEATVPTCRDDYAGKMTRRWMEGMIRHWRDKAEELEEQLRQLDLKTGGRDDTHAGGGETASRKENAP
jgi:transcriptional regulator with XRE-family HTH domain